MTRDHRRMLPLCSDLRTHVLEIVFEWQALTAEEPWLAVTREHRLESLAEVVLGLIDAAVCEVNDGREAALRRLIGDAAAHGRSLREQGRTRELLLTESYLLREAIWRYLRRLSDRAGVGLILYLDHAVTAATRAAMLAFHAEEMHSGALARALDRVVRDANESMRVSGALPGSPGSPGDTAVRRLAPSRRR